MKKLYYFLFLLISSISVNAQIVNIPDAIFKSILLNASSSNNYAEDVNGNYIKIDTNNDGEIQFSEASNVYKLYLYSINNISNLTGIEAFVNLTWLQCMDHNLTELDVSNLSNLKTLMASNNNLTSINVSGLINLEYLGIYSNDLPSLNISGLINLKTLHVQGNNLNILDASNLPNLTNLSCNGNSLTSINVSNNPNLRSVSCEDNQLSDLDLSGLNELRFVSCFNNNLTTINLSFGLDKLENIEANDNNITNLDLSSLPNLGVLRIINNSINSLDLSNNPKIWILSIMNNPINYLNIKNGKDNLTLGDINIGTGTGLPANCYICVDDIDTIDFDPSLTPEGTFYNSFCQFNPGGEFNTIRGYSIFDTNNNGICEVGIDNQHIFSKISVSNNGVEGFIYTNNSGYYNAQVQNGIYVISPQTSENNSLFNFEPLNQQIIFPFVNDSEEEVNFCITPNGIHPDVEVIISPLKPARPGFEATYKVVYRNKGNQTVSGNINFEFNADLLDFNSSNPIPANQSTGLLNYNFTELHPFESRQITLSFQVNTPTENPPVNIDDVLNFTAEIQINPTDENPQDNTFHFDQIVVGSYDPNDITCLEGVSVSPEMIGEKLHYRIRFENTGNFPAERVVVAMGINPEEYDISSFQLLNTSHQVQARVVNNKAEFFFEDIQLQPNGEGDILFSIKSLNSLQTGDSVMSYADIYFDYNYPITTNEAETTFEILGLNENNPNVQVSVYPNPSKDFIKIKSDSKIKKIELYDTSARLLKVSMADKFELSQNLSPFPNGIYFVKIYTEKGITTQKIIKQ